MVVVEGEPGVVEGHCEQQMKRGYGQGGAGENWHERRVQLGLECDYLEERV